MSDCCPLSSHTAQIPAAAQLVRKPTRQRAAGSSRATTTRTHRRYEHPRNATPNTIRQLGTIEEVVETSANTRKLLGARERVPRRVRELRDVLAARHVGLSKRRRYQRPTAWAAWRLGEHELLAEPVRIERDRKDLV